MLVAHFASQLTNERGLYRGQFQIAGDCCERQPAIRIGSFTEMTNQQFDLAVARLRQDQVLKQFGEGAHHSTSSS